MSFVTSVFRASSFGRSSGAVASSAMTTHISRSSPTSIWSSSEPRSVSALATPMAAWASSTAPFASIVG